MVIGHTYIIFNLSNIIQFSASFDKVDILRGNGIFFSKMLHPKVQLMCFFVFFFLLTRAPVAVSATFTLVGGGGVKMITPKSKTKRARKVREKHSIALNE